MAIKKCIEKCYFCNDFRAGREISTRQLAVGEKIFKLGE